jgi:hypothetical protein
MSTTIPENRKSPNNGKASLRVAVQAAIDAYAISGRMLNAALAYASHGYPVFPLDEITKAPIPKRDPDPTGRFPKGFPGTGGVYKATCDELMIRRWWKHREYLIGLPMGPKTGAWAVDIDTDEEHAHNGIAAWAILTAEHGEVVTREQRTASEGLHKLLNWDDDHPIGCSRGSIPKGIDIKGRGGYIVVPPSRRKGRAYYVGVDLDPVDAPDWLIKMIDTRPVRVDTPLPDDEPPSTVINGPWNGPAVLNLVPRSREIELLSDAMRYVPNNDLEWDDWTNYGLALYAATKGSEEGRLLFHYVSMKSSKNDETATQERWEQICGSPPNRIGADYLFKIASLNGWRITPTAPVAVYGKLAVARRKLGEIYDKFLDYLRLRNDPEKWSRYLDFHFEMYGIGEPVLPPVLAVRIGTGIGKTSSVIKKFAATDFSFFYTTPTHELAGKVAKQFIDLGIDAVVFRGRDRDDPDNPGNKMCLDLERVEQALKARTDVTKTCCKFKQFKCPLLEQCGYWKQKQLKPQVWIAASNVLFHKQDALGKPDAVIADEAFWQNSLVGLKKEESISVPLAVFANGCVEERIIARQLAKQIEDGGLQWQIMIEHDELDDDLLYHLIGKLWVEVDKLQREFTPETPIATIKRKQKVIADLALTHEKIVIVKELRAFLRRRKVVESGRLLLDHHRGQRIIKWRGVKPINQQFMVPTLLLDATLPGKKILKLLHQQVEIVAEITVPMPEGVHIRQVRNTPTSDEKLGDPDTEKKKSAVEKNRRAVRRYILQRWFETGRKKSLVICQLEYEEWLRGKLPKEIDTLHYNNLAGLDEFKDVRLQILIGRVQPGPEAVEAITGTLSGVMPVRANHRKSLTNFTWYTPVWRGVRLKDGSGVPMHCDQHPDPLGEQVRWQICEGEAIQGDGRARGVNHDKDHPLDTDRLFNMVLPDTTDEVTDWEKPNLLWETIAEGVVLTAPIDLVKVWPDLWPNEKAAYRSIKDGLPTLPGFTEVTYRLAGPKMKPRVGYFDLNLIPEPRAWLKKRLGPLTPL